MESSLVGQTIAGVYHVEDEIASGGMGVVYRAEDLRLQRNVAIKVMHTHVAQDVRVLQRFDREAKATASLNHPNIIQVFDVGVHDDIPFFVMEFIAEPTLAQVIKRYGYGRGIPLDLFLKITHSLCRGLAHAHKNGLVHRDLKPANIFVAEDGRAIIADFGLVHVESATKLTKTGTYVGTPVYLSPEAALGERATSLSDIYQVGIIMHEMLAGMRPFPGKYIRGLSGDSFPDSYRRICQKRQDVSPWLDEVIEKCLSIDPKERYRTTLELERALEPKTVVMKQKYESSSKKKLATLLPILTIIILALYFLHSSSLEITQIKLEKGVGGLRLSVETDIACKAMAICRSKGLLPIVVENNEMKRRHTLSFKGLTADRSYELQAIVTAKNETKKSKTITSTPQGPPDFQVDLSVRKGTVEAKFDLPAKWQVKAHLISPSRTEIPAAIERRDDSVLCRGKLEESGKKYYIALRFQSEDWEEFSLPPFSFHAPGRADQERSVGISLWNTLCRNDLLDAVLPQRTFDKLKAEGVSRLCLPWRPTARIDSLATNTKLAHQAGFAVDVVLFINKTPSQQKAFLQKLRQLLVQSGNNVETYYLSAFIDGMGWYTSTSDYVNLLTQIRLILSEENIKAVVQAGSLGMLKDPSFASNLIKTSEMAFRAGAALAYSPCLRSDEWGIKRRLACYEAIFKTAGLERPSWTAFIGTPSEEPPFYDTPLSSLVLGEKSLRNIGNPDLIFLSSDEGKALAEKDRATMVNFFASANLSANAMADEMVKESIRAFRGNVSPIHWVITPEDTAALYKGEQSTFAHIIASLETALPNGKPVSDYISGASLAGFGVKAPKVNALEWYVFEGPKERRVALWPKKRGEKIKVIVESRGKFITVFSLDALRSHYLFLPLPDGHTSIEIDGPTVVVFDD